MAESYLIICNSYLVDYFSELLKEESLSFILSRAEFEALEKEQIELYNKIIITVEIEWSDKLNADYFGFYLAADLRLRLKCLAPILLLSVFDKEYFLRTNDVKYNILKARGTYFMQMPISATEIKALFSKATPLSFAALTYLSILLVDIRYLIDLVTHTVRLDRSSDILIETLKKISSQIINISIKDRIKNIAEQIISNHQQQDEFEFYRSKKSLIDELNLYLYSQTKESTEGFLNKKRKLLLLDDDKTDLEWAEKALLPYFEVIPFQDAIEAKEFIQQDVNNDLSAIICDWQLLKPGTNEHQELLGFEVLEFASKRGFYALFSLTSTDDFSTREMDAALNFEHQLFVKDFQKSDALWSIYIPIIQQKTDRIVSLIANLPTGEAWNNEYKLDYVLKDGKKVAFKKHHKSFKNQYIEKRNDGQWQLFESAISEEASNLWIYYSKAFDQDQRDEIFDIKAQWGIELNRDLRNFLIIRRLYFAFWFNKTKLDISFKVPKKGYIENPIINIYSVLRKRYFSDLLQFDESEIAYRKLLNAAKVFVNKLSIEPKFLPTGLLPEEKSWLANHRIDINKGNDNLYYED